MSDLVNRLRIRLCIADANEAADRIEALEAALHMITVWVHQNPEANAGDPAGEELLNIAVMIAALNKDAGEING